MQPLGKLYIVATPIGNLGDITGRALQVLATVAWIAAEDTRHSKRLLEHYNIATRLLSLHEHNENARSAQLIKYLQQGEDIALISDAGTPLISDPGYRLVTLVRAQGIEVVPLPGACAAIAALSASGLPSDRFVFEGFLPPKGLAREKRLQVLKDESRTLIFYESVHRIENFLQLLQQVMGEERLVVVARELTKAYESILSGSAAELLQHFQENPQQCKGEFVVLVRGCRASKEIDEQVIRILNILLVDLPLKQAVDLTTEIVQGQRQAIYQLALKLRDA